MANELSVSEAALRRRDLVRHLRRQGIADARVLDALEQIPRERFIRADARDWAYDDRALAIECGQTISQPFIVALMTEALALRGGERVLEIGTGSGYQTALLAQLAGEVFTIERHAELSRHAQIALADLSVGNVRFRIGDGSLGWPEEAPFDRIIVTAAAGELPAKLWEQLAEGGLLVAPVGDSESQLLQVWRKMPQGPESRVLCSCRFVPLVSG